MLQTSRILVRAISHARFAVIGAAGLAGLSGCGQPGPLYLPTEPAAAHRATLPQTLWPGRPDKSQATPTAPAPQTGTLPPAPATLSTPSSSPVQ